MTLGTQERPATRRAAATRHIVEQPREPRGLPPLSAGAALFPLRLFLGVTFVYAGIQKLSDPGFLHPGAPTYIGTQLHGFANGTPGGFLLRAFALPQPKLTGVATALLEILIGLLVTTGLLTRAAAAVGLGLNFVLFLTNSWNAYPYFLGSDIVFVFAWLPFVLAGAAGQPALDTAVARVAGRSRSRAGARGLSSPVVSRRDVVLKMLGIAGFATLGIGGVSALAKGSYRKAGKTLALGGGNHAHAKAGAHHSAAHHHASHASGASVPQGAVKLGRASALGPGQAATYRDPKDGNPDILIRGSDGKLTAFSAVCTHAGCTVGYSGGQIACPCHGGTYDPKTGAVTGGPPPSPLAKKRVVESGGEIYAVPT